jgi:hypothetical protein
LPSASTSFPPPSNIGHLQAMRDGARDSMRKVRVFLDIISSIC